MLALNTTVVSDSAFTILVERNDQIAARENLLDRVLGEVRFRRASERMREGRLPAISLNAIDQFGAVIGTIRLWHIQADGLSDALLLGPLAVDLAFQGLGIGGALMKAALAHARKAAFSAIILVGDPEYYARFGFDAATANKLAMPGPFERRRLLGLELQFGALANARGLIVAAGPAVIITKAVRKVAA
jgi:predicted N-acetyltransferase YhbS